MSRLVIGRWYRALLINDGTTIEITGKLEREHGSRIYLVEGTTIVNGRIKRVRKQVINTGSSSFRRITPI